MVNNLFVLFQTITQQRTHIMHTIIIKYDDFFIKIYNMIH